MFHKFKKIMAKALCGGLTCFLVSTSILQLQAATTPGTASGATTGATTGEQLSGYTEIYDAKGLQAIANDPNGKYILMEDISLNNMDWYPINLFGTFDGNGHTIYDLKSTQLNTTSNISVDGNDKKYETYFSGLFGQAVNAVIKNVNIKACDIRITTDKNCFAACLAGYTENTEITNCTVQGDVYLYSKNTMCGVAGITGFGYGTVTGCQTDVTLVIVDQNDANKKCEQFLGGILASGYTDIENCIVNVKGYASIHGYAHNGGIVGMHYIHTLDNAHAGYVRNNVVNGFISFYENNKDRRAYCAAYIGETLNSHVTNQGNSTISFKRDERYEYDKILLPDACTNPVYLETVTEPTCTEMGFTKYACKTCGYSYVAQYTFLAHKAGDPKTVILPTYVETGLKKTCCTVCGEVITEVEIPKIIYANNCILERKELMLSDKSTYKFSADVAAEDDSNWKVNWYSSDESVVTINENGEAHSTGRGNAVITCSLEDGTTLGECAVTVQYIAWKWMMGIAFLGVVVVVGVVSVLLHIRRKQRR